MKLIMSVYLQGDNDSELQLENPSYIPAVGETFVYSARATGQQVTTGRRTYRVLERKSHFVEVGGSEPTGSEDYCHVGVIVEEIKQNQDDPFLEPLTDSIQ